MAFKYGPYSPSRLQVAACPARFKAEYIDRDTDASSIEEFKRGSVVHEVFEEITKGLMRKAPLSWAQVEDELGRRLAKYSLTKEDEVFFCIQACRAFLENLPDNIDDIVGTEEQLAIKNVNGTWVEATWNDCDFRGKIDILFIMGERALFIDHKTQPFIEKANTFQMGFYAWMIKVHYPQVKVVESILHFANPSINFYSDPYPWSENDLSNIEVQAKLSAMAIENAHSYDAVPNFHCKYCPILLKCSVAQNFYERRSAYGRLKNAPLRTAGEAVELAEVLTVIDEGRNVLNKRLQKFVKEIGPVHITGKEYNYAISESYAPKSDADKAEILEIIRSAGLNPMKYFKLDTYALKGLWRHMTPDALIKIKGHLKQVKKSTFGGKKT